MTIGLLRRLHIWGSWVPAAEWQLATTDDVLGFLTMEDGTDRLCRNVGKELTTTRCVIAQKSAVLIYFAAEACNPDVLCCFSQPLQRLDSVCNYDMAFI